VCGLLRLRSSVCIIDVISHLVSYLAVHIEQYITKQHHFKHAHHIIGADVEEMGSVIGVITEVGIDRTKERELLICKESMRSNNLGKG
jgi:hypothetical protein